MLDHYLHWRFLPRLHWHRHLYVRWTRRLRSAGQVLSNRSLLSVNDAQRGGGSGGLLGSIFGCAASSNSQTIGTIAGGAVGGLLGNRIAGSGSRSLGTILGGALDATAGSAVGCKLQQNDRIRAERAT